MRVFVFGFVKKSPGFCFLGASVLKMAGGFFRVRHLVFVKVYGGERVVFVAL